MWRRKPSKLSSCRPCVRHSQGSNIIPLSPSASFLHVTRFSLAVLVLRSLSAAQTSSGPGALRCATRSLSTATTSSPSSSSSSSVFREDGPEDAMLRGQACGAFLSQRRIRQLEHQHGPAWRYVLPENTFAQGSRTSKPVRNTTKELAREKAFIDEWLRLRHEAENSMLVGTHSHTSEKEGNAPATSSRDGTETNTPRSSRGFGPHAHGRMISEEDAPETDPLIEFMERHHEDGEVMLAMWTSLRRSCLYRSELTEATALLVRRVFHTLIRHRAVLAATRLYYRLLEIGVQLSSADVLVLLTNLPYERSTTHAKAREKEWMVDSTPSWMAKKRAQDEAERKATGNSQKKPAESSQRTEETRSKETHANLSTNEHVAASAAAPEPRGGGGPYDVDPVAIACDVAPQDGVGTHSAIPVDVASLGPLGAALFDNRPEWIRRWILYEASMGNIELYDDANPLERSFTAVEDETMPHAAEMNVSALNSADAVNSSDGVNDDDTGTYFDGEVLDDKVVMQEAKEAIEVTALISHLLLLQEEADARSHSRSAAKTRVGGMESHIYVRNRPSGNGRYWAEALSLASVYVSRVSSRAPDNKTVEMSLTSPARVSKEFEEGVRIAVAASNSWKVSLHFLENVHRVFTPAPRDAITFMDVAAPHAPWKKSPVVEAFMHERVIPLLGPPTAASYAVRAIWNAHVCLIKEQSPDTYVCRFSETESLAALLQNTVAAARLSASHLAIEATRYRDMERASRTMSTSEKGGLFTEHSATKDTPIMVADTNATTFVTQEALAKEQRIRLMPVELQRTMRLVGEGVVAVAWLAPVLAEAENLGVIAVSSLVSDTLYGDYGLLQTFAMFYDVQSNDPRLIRRAEERAEVAEALCCCVLDVLLSITQIRENRSNAQRMARLANPGILLPENRLVPVSQVADFLLQVTHLLVHITRRSGNTSHTDMSRLQARLVSITKRLLGYLGIMQDNQMTLFGPSSPEVVTAIAMFIRASHLVGMRAVWERLPPSAKHALRVATSQTNACGKMVCHELLDVELRDVNDVIHSTASRRRERGGVAKLHGQYSSRPSPPQSAVAVKRILSPTDLKQVQEQAEVNSCVAAALRSSGGPSSATLDAALQSIISAPTASWETSLRVTSSVLRHWRVPLNTVSVNFFRSVIETLARDNGSHSASPTQAPENSAQRAPPSSASPSSWLNAIAVFWAAVDHTGQRSTSASVKPSDHAKNQHEKDVLKELIVPLVRVAVSSGREGVARQWSRSWQAMYQGNEKKTREWELARVRVLIETKDHRALRACSQAREKLVSSPDVDLQLVRNLDENLRKISMWHVNWWEALSTLQQTYMKSSSQEKSTSATSTTTKKEPFDAAVVPVLLRVLRRCPKNLTRSAHSLYEAQGDEWNAACSVELLRIIVRARQWVAALQHISDVTARGLIPPVESVSTGVGSAEAGDMAALILCGLQACAIGGRSDEAGVLYDSYKQWRHLSSLENTQVGKQIPHQERTGGAKPRVRLSSAAESIEQMLDSALADGPSDGISSYGGSGDVEGSTLRVEDDNDQRARLLFFRAMTKKSIKAAESSRSRHSKD